VPNLSSGSDELHDARDLAVTLELTNRFANVRDPRAEEKTLWVQAKRGVLAILRVQPAKDLVEALMKPVSPEHQAMWEEIIQNEAIMDHQRNRRMPSTAGAEYRLEDIRE
jgi:Ras GTPase-activating-like protein IQGAP2/3